jgi:hypothetical protein
LVNFLDGQIHWSFAQIIFQAGFATQGDVNKDAMVLLDGARPPHKYAFKNNMSLMNSKIQPT